MDVIGINRNNKIYAIKPLGTKLIAEEPDRLLIVFSDLENHKIGVGQELVFRRYVYGDDDKMETITTGVEVLEKTTYEDMLAVYDSGATEIVKEREAVYTTIPECKKLRPLVSNTERLNIKRSSGDCITINDAYFDDFNRYLVVKTANGYEINDWLYYYKTDDDEFFVIEFDEDHEIFAQDVYIADTYTEKGYTIDVKNNREGKIGQLGGISVTFTGLPYTVTSGDTLECGDLNSCGKFDNKGEMYSMKLCRYTYAPSSFSRRRIIFREANTTQADGDFFDKVAYIIKNGSIYQPRYNPFYFYTMEGVLKRCTMWYDPWWPMMKTANNNNPKKKIYVNSGDSRVVFGVENDYWHIPTVTFAADEFSLGIEEDQGGKYVDRIIDEAIPSVIDMERVKYIPVIEEGEDYKRAKSITFDFHFRKRDVKKMIESKIAEGGEYPIYKDGWYVSKDSGNTVWWNGFDYEGADFDSEAFTEYYEASGRSSDLLGYLGFVDEDVYYRKSRLSMSFIRISFYTSKDPLEQKLLYYSTSFLDATSLFGKYMNQSWSKFVKYGEYEDTPVIFYPDNSISARVDTEICIKNEFNNLASSEGFNLYLFADDIEKNSDRTIYMKVEFNHAGNGKTIPMMMWPKDGNDNFRRLTTDSFLNDVYIPVKVGYINDRFCYWLPTAENDNGNIRLVLFEPKLSFNEDLGHD